MTEIYWFAGFDRGNPFPDVDFFGYGSPNAWITTLASVTGKRSFRFHSNPTNSNWVRRKFPNQVTYPTVSCHLHPSDVFRVNIGNNIVTNGFPYIMITAVDWTSYKIAYDANNFVWSLIRSNSIVIQGSIRILQNDWYHHELAIFYHQHSGFVRHWLDGHLNIEYTGPTCGQKQAYAEFAYWGGGTYSVLHSHNCFLDNPVIGGYGRLRDCRVEEFAPNRDLSVMFTRNTKTANWMTVSEELPDSGDFNFATESGYVDVLGAQSFSSLTVNGFQKKILAVQTWVEAKMDIASGDKIIVGIVCNSSVAKTENILFDSYYRAYHVSNVSPVTNTNWTANEFNNSGIWYETLIENE